MFGIDVSHNNGTIDWNLVSKNAQKVDFAFIKATEGVTFTDPKFIKNATQAKSCGVRAGYYHFASLNTTNNVVDAKSEADFFTSKIKQAPISNLPLILDIETNKVGLDKNKVLQWINTFFQEMKNNGYPNVALYSYTPFLNSNLPANHGLGDIKLWIAAYVNRSSPKLPTGWNNYWIWQYSCTGNLQGIKGSVDFNRTIDPI